MSERQPHSLTDRIVADLAHVQWLSAAEIRTRARRRTARTVALVPAVLVLVIAAGWAGTGLLGGSGHGAAGPASPTTTVAPTPSAGANATPSPTPRGTESDDRIPFEALLQPEDVGPEYELDPESQASSGPGEDLYWWFDLSECPGYARLGITTWRGDLQRISQDLKFKGDVPDDVIEAILVEARRYPGRDASRVVRDALRVVEACGQYVVEGAIGGNRFQPYDRWMRLELLKRDFAGESSLLVRKVVTSVDPATGQKLGTDVTQMAVVQVADRVTYLFRWGGSPEQMVRLAKRAAERLCNNAEPRC